MGRKKNNNAGKANDANSANNINNTNNADPDMPEGCFKDVEQLSDLQMRQFLEEEIATEIQKLHSVRQAEMLLARNFHLEVDRELIKLLNLKRQLNSNNGEPKLHERPVERPVAQSWLPTPPADQFGPIQKLICLCIAMCVYLWGIWVLLREAFRLWAWLLSLIFLR